MSAFNHRLRVIPDRSSLQGVCRTGKCGRRAAFLHRYDYLTGWGRVTWAARPVCEVHAAGVAAKHGLEIPA